MHVLIAGCGYVGVRLAASLQESGYEVTGIKRSATEEHPGIQWIQGNICEPASIQIAKPVDLLVLAAGLRRDTAENYQRLLVDGYRGLLDELRNRRHPIQRVVLVSTTAVFAEHDGGWVDETSPVTDDGLPARYFLNAEAVVRASGFQAVVVRLAGLYGPGRIRLIREVREGRAAHMSPPAQYLNQLHADDAAGALAHIVRLHDPAPLYVASDRDPADRNEVLAWIADQLGVGPLPRADELAPSTARRSGNKRCRSILLERSGYAFRYPTYREGYANLLRE